jgi:hypothetical protein
MRHVAPIKILFNHLRREDYMGDEGIDRNIILKCIFRKELTSLGS